MTDARQLLERWTRENILDPQDNKLPQSKPGRDTRQPSAESGSDENIMPSFSGTEAVSEPKPIEAAPEKKSKPIAAAKPDVITRVVTEEVKDDRPVRPKIELPPPRPRVTPPKKDVEPPANDDESDQREEKQQAIVPAPRFSALERLKAAKDASAAKAEAPASEEPAALVADDNTTTEERVGDRVSERSPTVDIDGPTPVPPNASNEKSKEKPTFRIDASHPNPGDQSLLDIAFSRSVDDHAMRTANSPLPIEYTLPRGEEPVTHHVHPSHPHLSGAHFDVQAMIREQNEDKPRQSTQSIFGQILAYLGVGVLTLGAGCVLWGYFGAAQYSHLAPTGWLITTAGQMLLFLGVVTLIAGGLEQTNTIVHQRLDNWERKWMEVNGNIYRADPPTTQAMGQGPHVPAESFRENKAFSEMHSSESRT